MSSSFPSNLAVLSSNPSWPRSSGSDRSKIYDLVFTLGLLALAMALPTGLFAQAVSNPNQIVGTVEVTNTNPDLLDYLADNGLRSGSVYANSTGISPTLSGSVGLQIIDSLNGDFEITVEAGSTGAGIVYNVYADLWFSNRIRLSNQATDPLEEEPAADQALSFEVCVGRVDLSFEDATGDPAVGVNSSVNIYRENTPGSGGFGWIGSASGNATSLQALVPGDDSTYHRLDLRYRQTLSSGNTYDYTEQIFVHVGCDEIVPLTVVIPDPPEVSDLVGKIIGQVDMLGEEETSTITVAASSGPFSDLGSDRVDPPLPGTFEITDLLPSDTVDPPAGYFMQAWGFNIGSGERVQNYQTPYRWSNNGGKVEVGPGETVDLGNTFVIDPGYVGGTVQLVGPVEGASGLESCLTALTSNSRVRSWGSSTRAPGATLSAVGGFSHVFFPRPFDPALGEILSDYELAIGGLSGESTFWTVQDMWLTFTDTSTPQDPNTYFNSSFSTTELDRPLFLMEPGQDQESSFAKCFSQVNMGFRSTQGTFYQPRLSFSGTFDDTDFTGAAAEYRVSGSGWGTPTNLAAAADRGQVSLCLPAGEYSFTPTVTSVTNSGTSSTELPPVSLTVGCRQVLDVLSTIQVALDPAPACAATSSLTVTGSTTSSAAVSRIDRTVNGSTSGLCTDCGDNPSFSFDATLGACGNTIAVEAENELGDVASTSVLTRLDHDPPTLDACPDIDILTTPGSDGTVVDYGLGASDVCDGARPVICDIPSGSFLPAGEYAIACSATDACGNATMCGFNARIRDGSDFCFDTGFDDRDLDEDWIFSLLGDADQGDLRVLDSQLLLSGNGTSLYHGDDNAAYFSRWVARDFRVEVDIEDFPVDEGGAVRKAALMVRSGSGPADPRVMVTFVPHLPDPPTTAIQFDARDAAGNAFEIAGTDLDVPLPVRLSIERQGDVFTVRYSTDEGATWIQPEGDLGGTVTIDMGESVQAGIAVASYDATTQLTAAFDDFSLCTPDTTVVDPDDPPECDADRALDVVVLLDASSSMSHVFGGEVRFEAARNMAHDLLDVLAADDPNHRVALATFAGDGTGFTQVHSDFGLGAFSQDYGALHASLDALVQPAEVPLWSTPTAHALAEVHDLLTLDGDPNRRPILVWATDGVPDVDIEGRGPGIEGPLGYGLNEVQDIVIQDGAGGFLPVGIVRQLGDFNTAYGTRDGEVVADAMFGLEWLEGTFDELLVYGLALQGDGVNLGTFNDDLLAYGAYLSGTPYFTSTNADELAASLGDVLDELACGATGFALVGDRVWSDVDGDGVQDGSEPGLIGVGVEILDSGGTVVASTTTGEDGAYQLGPLAPGTYTLRVVAADLAEGSTASHDPDGIATAHEAVITVAQWQVVRDADFGYVPPPSDPLAGCFVDDFEDGVVDPAWTLDGLGDAALVTADEAGGVLDLTSDGSSWWGSDQHGFLYQQVSGDFRFEADLEGFPVDAGGQFRKAGIEVRSSLDPLAPRLMAAVVPHFPNPERSVLQTGVRSTAGGASQDLAEPLFAEAPVRLAIERRGNVLDVYYSGNGGETWVQPIDGGTITLDLGDTVLVGLGAASYDNATTLTARFDDTLLCPLDP